MSTHGLRTPQSPVEGLPEGIDLHEADDIRTTNRVCTGDMGIDFKWCQSIDIRLTFQWIRTAEGQRIRGALHTSTSLDLTGAVVIDPVPKPIRIDYTSNPIRTTTRDREREKCCAETRTVTVVDRFGENVIEVFREGILQRTHGDIGNLCPHDSGCIVTIGSGSDGLEVIVLVAHDLLIRVQAVRHISGDAHRHKDCDRRDR